MLIYRLERHATSDDLRDYFYVTVWDMDATRAQDVILDLHGPVYASDVVDIRGQIVNADWWRDAFDPDAEPDALPDDILWYTLQTWRTVATHEETTP
jgi:hypothetical protein